MDNENFKIGGGSKVPLKKSNTQNAEQQGYQQPQQPQPQPQSNSKYKNASNFNIISGQDNNYNNNYNNKPQSQPQYQQDSYQQQRGGNQYQEPQQPESYPNDVMSEQEYIQMMQDYTDQQNSQNPNLPNRYVHSREEYENYIKYMSSQKVFNGYLKTIGATTRKHLQKSI